MKSRTNILIAMMALLIVCLGPACFPKRPVHRNHTFEFRLAETKMGDGLIEQTVANSGEKIYLHKEPIITTDDINHASVITGRADDYQVNVRFTGEGARRMEKATSENISKRMAILMDGKILTAPMIQATIGISCIITGSFTRESAQNLANAINGE